MPIQGSLYLGSFSQAQRLNFDTSVQEGETPHSFNSPSEVGQTGDHGWVVEAIILTYGHSPQTWS